MGFGTGKYETLQHLALKLLPGEPYFVLRSKDLLAPAAVEAYARSLEAAAYGVNGLPPTVFKGAGVAESAIEVQAEGLRDGAKDVTEFANRMREWQASHAELCKLPD